MTRQPRTPSGSGSRALTSGLVLFAFLAAHGCKSEEPKYTTPKPRRDAAVEEDAGRDASVDPGDAEPGDGGGGDGGDGGGGEVDGGDASTGPGDDPCQLNDDDNNTFTAPVPFSDEGRFSLNIGTTGFGVAYQGTSVSCGAAGNISVLPVQASGAFPSPEVPVEHCKTIRDVTLLHVPGGWRMVWLDTAAGSAELQTMLLPENMKLPATVPPARLTTNMLLEQRPTLANVGGQPLLAYIAVDNAKATVGRVMTTRLSDGASPHEIVSTDAGRKPQSLALTQIGDKNAAIAWVDEEGKPGVWLQRLDLEGAPVGEPVLLNGAVSAGTTVDLAVRKPNQGGAALYSLALGGVNNEVRFRLLNASGEPLADEVKVVGAPLQGRDASFARLGGGYAVAYRALPGGPITSPEIRLAFISREGYVMRDRQGGLISYKIADATDGGGRLTVRVSTDGQLLVGFVDVTDSGEQLRLVRKRLDCAL